MSKNPYGAHNQRTFKDLQGNRGHTMYKAMSLIDVGGPHKSIKKTAMQMNVCPVSNVLSYWIYWVDDYFL